MKKRVVASVVAVVLAICCVVGGTLAWLTDKTDEVKNTFTVGNVDITLTESEKLDLKMVPGHTIKKDPKVTVKDGSEACYVFVKVEKTPNLDNFINYTMVEDWKELPGVNGVYYRESLNNTGDQVYPVLQDNEVTVREEVTKDMMDKITVGPDPDVTPSLNFTAYAVQYYRTNGAEFTPEEAWAKVNP